MIRRLGAVVTALLVSSCIAVTTATLSGSASESSIEEIARKQIVSTPQTSGPNGSALSWGLNRIDQRTVALTSAASYDFTEDGAGVTAYILDSGVNASHQEFGGRVKEGWSYRNSSTALTSYRSALSDYVANPNNGIASCPNDGSHAVDPGPFDNPASVDATDKGQTDNDGHGTHVAGIIGGDTTGVAKNVFIVPVRSLDSCGNGTTTMINEGLDWIINHHVTGDKAVLNLSVGFTNQVSSVDTRITTLMNEGVVVIAAAGNSATTACGTTPAATAGTISVGSIASTDVESSFSNYGNCVDILSPGGSIFSSYPYANGSTNTYVGLSGTSMAAPFVTGSVARYLQVLDNGPTDFATGPTAAWTWLRDNATTNAVTYYNLSRSPQTANRLLYVAPSTVRVEQLTAAAADASAVVSWSNAQAGTTYTARAIPGNATCSVSSAATCTISGLTNGVNYLITVVASSANGKGASSASVTPTGPPLAPATLTASTASKSTVLTWSVVPNSSVVTYTVKLANGTTVCTTTATTCTVTGLTNGIDYSFTVSSQAQGMMSVATSQSVVVRPGFRVLKTAVNKRSKTSLTALVKSISTGKKTWSETGSCVIWRTYLLAPNKKTTCKITLKVAKTSKYPAMSTKVTITVK